MNGLSVEPGSNGVLIAESDADRPDLTRMRIGDQYVPATSFRSLDRFLESLERDLLQIHIEREHDLAAGTRRFDENALAGDLTANVVPRHDDLAGVTAQQFLERLLHTPATSVVADQAQHTV